ncbi:MAG TPA: TM2 domain-containing protein [Candidatus Eisenbacteria bacterium]|nr:TM2 domain-containing protein [Candidatus Eisenbacteria bacterium]
MALIACPDCGKQVSSEAVSCPECARPIRAGFARPPGHATTERGPEPLLVRTQKSRGSFIALGLFLGCFGIHNFYAGYHGKGAAQLATTLILGWVVVGFVITAIWALIEVITVREDAQGIPMS